MIGRSPEVVLKDAAAYIEEKGWHQGSIVNARTGTVCTLGAIKAVTCGLYAAQCDEEGISAVDLLKDRIRPAGYFMVSHWNDQPKRTKDEVLSLLRGE